MLALYGLPLKPRVVLWQFTGNDPSDDFMLVRKQSALTGTLVAVRRWLVYHSVLFNLQTLAREHIQAGLTRGRDSELRLYVRGEVHFFLQRHNWATSLARAAATRDGWRFTERALLDAQTAAARAGAAFAVVNVPFKEEVYREAVSELFPDEPLLPQSERAATRLGEFLRAHHIPYLDATEDLAEHASRGEQLYSPDLHLNAQGNRALAGIVERFLRSQHVLRSH